jgi:Transposase, Mutator family
MDPDRAELRARQRELAERLKASGALDQIFAQIDSGSVPLTGDDGLLKVMLKAALERGLEVELTDHVGYERGDPDASTFPNSRNGTTPKTVASEVGEVELAIPRDRNGSFVPRLVPKGSRRVGGAFLLHQRHLQQGKGSVRTVAYPRKLAARCRPGRTFQLQIPPRQVAADGAAAFPSGHIQILPVAPVQRTTDRSMAEPHAS